MCLAQPRRQGVALLRSSRLMAATRAINISPRWGEIHRTYFFHNCCDGIRKARLNLLDAFSQAIVAVSSTNASSS